MPTTLEDFKQAFASKATDDDLTAHDKTFAKSLKKLDQAIDNLGNDPSADRSRSAREKLVERYRDARSKNGLSNKEIAALLDEVITQTDAVATKINAQPRNTGWSISPDAVVKQGAPVYALPGQPGALVPQIDPEFFQKMEEERKKKEAQKLKDAQDALDQARKWLCGLSTDELYKLSFPEILIKIKEKYPAIGDLPRSSRVLMEMVNKVLETNGYMMTRRMSGDPMKMAMETVIATYIASLASNIKPIVSEGGIKLVMAGAAAATGGGGGGEKSGDKQPGPFEFKNKHYTIEIANQAWQALDPSMRAKWKSLNDEATTLEKIEAALTSLKKEWSSEQDGSARKIELEAKIKDLEAEFKGKWTSLQNEINATAKLTTDGFKATITEAKKKIKDDKIGAELELKFEEMSVGLKAFANTPDLKTALTVTGSAEKITAKIEAEAIKSGTVVTLNYEKALKEVKEQIELQIKQGNTSVAAKLSKEAVKLEDKLKELKDAKTKDFKDVKALEDGLSQLKFEVKTEFKVGNFKISGGGQATSGGEVGGTVQVDMMLKTGITFDGQGPIVRLRANVTNKGYTVELMFKIGDMPDLKDVHSANKEADERIRALYKLVQDTSIRSLDDAKKIEAEFEKVMKPLKKSVESMKKLDKKKMAVELGLTVTGEFPSGGTMPTPSAGLGLKLTF